MLRKIILIALLFLFVVFSFFVVFYNSGKSVLEYKEWGKLSDTQKREKIFGSIYDVYQMVNSKTNKESAILLYTSDVMPYFVLRYFLYPQKIFYTSEKSQFVTGAREKKYEFLVLYGADFHVEGYKKIAEIKKDRKLEGVLLKRQ